MTEPTPGRGGTGAPVSVEDERWRAASAELAPEKFLARVTTNARATVTTVTLVGTALTGFGLVSAQTLLMDDLTRGVAFMATAAAAAAVLLAVIFHAQRLDDVNVEDLAEVERWYGQQFRRARLAVGASWLLVLAVLLAALAGLLTLVRSDEDVAASLRATRGDASSILDAEVTARGLSPGSVLVVSLTAQGRPGCRQVTLWEGANRVGRTGEVTVKGSVTAAPCHGRFRLQLRDGAELRRSLTLP